MKRSLLTATLGLTLIGSTQLMGCADSEEVECLPGDIECSNSSGSGKADGFEGDDDEMWWFNVRASNTEPLLRLNVEAGDRETMTRIRDEVLGLIRGAPAPAGDVKERPE